MATLFVVVITLFNVKAQNACIWGRGQNYNDMINGEYMNNGIVVNGAPTFTKSYQPNGQTNFVNLYLWRAANNLYYITTDTATGIPTNSSTPNLSFARCTISTNSPWECGVNQWMVYDSTTFTLDPNVYSQKGSCPEWNCDAVDTTTINLSRCNVIWPIKVASNAWSNAAGTWWFYFHPLIFRWICHDEYVPNSFNSHTERTHSEPKWVELTKGSSVNLYFNYPVEQQYEIKCIGYTTDPTMMPTTGPTIQPTLLPTNYPTLIPSDDPTTTVPTSTPSSNHPTFSPSNNPLVIPSLMPTITPTASTNNATKAPTKNPTTLPTADPTNNPTLTPSHDHDMIVVAPIDDPTPSPSNNPSVIPTWSPMEVENISNTSKITASMLYIVIGCVVILIIVCSILSVVSYRICKQKKENEKKKNGLQNSLHLNKIELSKIPNTNSHSTVSQTESAKMRTDRKKNNNEYDEDESIEKIFDAGIDMRGDLMPHRVLSVSSGMSDDEGAPNNVEELYKGDIDTRGGLTTECKNNYTEKSSNTQQTISTMMPTTKRKHYAEWTADEVLVWIFGLDNGKYQKYGNDLRIALGKHGINGKAMPYMEKSDWISFGITDAIDSHNLEKHVEKLVNGEEEEGQIKHM